jgi:hypothetical protein
VSARDARSAVQEYVTAVQRIVSCVSAAHIDVRGGYFPSLRPHRLMVGDGTPVELNTHLGVWLDARQLYTVDRDETTTGRMAWNVRVVSYIYSLSNDARREILAYHWHPEGRSPVATPRFHLEAGSGVTRPRLRGAHLPTGHISLTHLIRCLIE